MASRLLLPAVFALLICQGNAFAKDGPPKVLILGDAFYQRMVRAVSTDLGKDATVVYQPSSYEEAAFTSNALAKLDEWLGEEKWDLIYFNFGLVDLTNRAPGMQSFRTMSGKVGGVRTTPVDDYGKNLNEIVKRLKQTGATLIWANIPPIRTNAKGLFEPGSEIEYNAMAAKVMKAHLIPIVDMHGWISEQVKDIQPQRNEPYDYGKALEVHPPVVTAIRKTLRLPPR